MTKNKPDDPPFGRKDSAAGIADSWYPHDWDRDWAAAGDGLRGRRARQGKAGKAAIRMQELDSAIVERAAALKRKLAISGKFADQIRPGLAAKLGYEPTEAAIKDGVRRIRGRKKVGSIRTDR